MVTGGAGFIGHAVVDLLHTLRTHELLVVDNLLYEDNYLRNVPFQAGNVGDPKFMIPLLKKFQPDVVIHLAGIVGDAACNARPQETRIANITSVEILRDYFEGKLIFPSSCSVYGANDDLVTEESPFNPLSLYAETKIRAEEILKDKPQVFIPRLGTVHGVTGRLRNDLVVNILSIRALIEGKISVFGGEQYRPMLHVRDLAEVMVGQSFAMCPGVFNLLERNYKIIDLAHIVQEVIPTVEIEVTEMEFEDRRNYKASGEKAKQQLKFAPKASICDTVTDIARIYREGRIKDFSHIKYSNISTLQFRGKL